MRFKTFKLKWRAWDSNPGPSNTNPLSCGGPMVFYLFAKTKTKQISTILDFALTRVLQFQVAVVDRELGILGEEREQNSRRLNLKRVQHVTTLQQLGENPRREPWSSGYGRRPVFKRLWVQIPAPYTGQTFFLYFCSKDCNLCLKIEN